MLLHVIEGMLKPIFDYYMWFYVKTDLWLLHVIEGMLKPIYDYYMWLSVC